jgi:heat shock protein HslJ
MKSSIKYIKLSLVALGLSVSAITFQNCSDANEFTGNKTFKSNTNQVEPIPRPIISGAEPPVGEFKMTNIQERVGCEDLNDPNISSLCYFKDTALREATIHFGNDGIVSGQAPCNKYQGVYTTANPNKMGIDRIVTTRRACPSLENEALMLSALEGVTDFEKISDDEYFLKSLKNLKIHIIRDCVTDCKPSLPFVPFEGDFYLKEYTQRISTGGTNPNELGLDYFVHHKFPGTTKISFWKNGDVRGYALCNSFVGKYHMDKNRNLTISIGAVSSVHCDKINEEQILLDGLEKMTHLSVSGKDSFTLTNKRFETIEISTRLP